MKPHCAPELGVHCAYCHPDENDYTSPEPLTRSASSDHPSEAEPEHPLTPLNVAPLRDVYDESGTQDDEYLIPIRGRQQSRK